MSEATKKNKIFVISMILLFLLIAGYIAIKISDIQRTSIGYADKETKESITCLQYSYIIRGQTYNEQTQEIIFTIKNNYGKNIKEIRLQIDELEEIKEIKTPILNAIGEEEITITNINTKPEKIYIYMPECEQIKKEVTF